MIQPITNKKYLNNCTLPFRKEPGKTILLISKKPVGKVITNEIRNAAI